jgi:hypothetical protein
VLGSGTGVRGTALPASLKAYGNSVRREGEIICKMAGEKFWGEFGVKWAFAGSDHARPWASSCSLRSCVSPVPRCEGAGAPSVWFLGVETGASYPWESGGAATRRNALNALFIRYL